MASMFELFFKCPDEATTTSATTATHSTTPPGENASNDFDHSIGAEELHALGVAFVSGVEAAPWFSGFAASNVSGASLSEFLQRHRGNPARATASVSGSSPHCLQTIVEQSPAYRTDASTNARKTRPPASKRAAATATATATVSVSACAAADAAADAAAARLIPSACRGCMDLAGPGLSFPSSVPSRSATGGSVIPARSCRAPADAWCRICNGIRQSQQESRGPVSAGPAYTCCVI